MAKSPQNWRENSPVIQSYRPKIVTQNKSQNLSNSNNTRRSTQFQNYLTYGNIQKFGYYSKNKTYC